MTRPLEGIRVLELAVYGLVPTAGAVLAEWGADVVKVEHPETGDPIRGLVAFGVKPGDGGVTYLWEIFNRGKRSIGVDVAHPEGRELVLSLAGEADVFLTNFLAPARRRLGVDAADVMARNPRIIYGRGTAHGNKGDDADRGGFDGISYWARTGMSIAAIPADYTHPIHLPGPAFGDIQTGMHLAGGIAAALFHRERTGRGCVVDTSLLASGLWAMQATMVGAQVTDRERLPAFDRRHPGNPLTNVYRSRDGRFVVLAFLEADRYWPGFCEAVGRPDLIDDPRFGTAQARLENVEECVGMLDDLFAERPFAEWQKILDSQDGQWATVQTPREALADQQAVVNGYVQTVAYETGAQLALVPAPVQFDEEVPQLSPGPAHAAHTDEVLGGLGLSTERLLELKLAGAIS